VSPFHRRQEDLGAVFFEGAGWERPRWYNANTPLIADQHWRRGAWETRNWSPINGAEHMATRTVASMMDLSPFIKVRVSGRGALGYLQRLAASNLDRPPGKVTYTVLLNEKGGITSDLTITRLADDEFLVVDGAGTGLRTISRIRDNAPTDGSVRVADDTSGWCCIAHLGPKGAGHRGFGRGGAADARPGSPRPK